MSTEPTSLEAVNAAFRDAQRQIIAGTPGLIREMTKMQEAWRSFAAAIAPNVFRAFAGLAQTIPPQQCTRTWKHWPHMRCTLVSRGQHQEPCRWGPLRWRNP